MVTDYMYMTSQHMSKGMIILTSINAILIFTIVGICSIAFVTNHLC